MTKDEALKLALVTLERTGNIAGFAHEREQAAITAIKEALAQPPLPVQPAQEPVAYIDVEQRRLQWAKPMNWNTPTTVNLPKIPLYTAPPAPLPVQEPISCARCKDLEEQAYDLLGQLKVANLKWSVAHPWVGLENKELFEILEKANTRYQAVEMTEAKLKEKNT